VDLAGLFEHVKRTLRQPPQVVGASWLYNLDAYRRLFPAPYLATARVLDHRFRHMPLTISYLNTDLDLISSDELTALAAVFESRGVFPLHVMRRDDGL